MPASLPALQPAPSVRDAQPRGSSASGSLGRGKRVGNGENEKGKRQEKKKEGGERGKKREKKWRKK